MKRCVRWLLGVWRVLNVSTWRWYRKDACWGVSPERLGCFFKLFQSCSATWLWFCLLPRSLLVFLNETDGRQRADVFIVQSLFCYGCGGVCSPNNNICFYLLCPPTSFYFSSLRSPTGSPMPGGDWRTRWGSQTWAGRSGSNSTTNMSRATQRGWASAARTAAQTVRLNCNFTATHLSSKRQLKIGNCSVSIFFIYLATSHFI